MQRTRLNSVVNPSYNIREMRPWLTPRAASILWNLLCLIAAGLAVVVTILTLAKAETVQQQRPETHLSAEEVLRASGTIR
jgi:hypothetical protein